MIMTSRYPLKEPIFNRSWQLLRLIIPHIGFIIAMTTIVSDRNLHLELLLPTYLLTAITGLGFTVGYHRLFSHRSFEPVKTLKICLAILGLMGSHLSIAEYAGIHRAHHAMSDRVGDPHSPRVGDKGFWRGFWYAHTGWLFDRDLDIKDLTRKYASDLVKDPLISRLDRLHFLWFALGLILPALLGWAVFQSREGLVTGFVWWGLVRIFLQDQIEFCTRAIAHCWGDRDFETKDYSTNHPIALLSLGEWHNNHHAFPHSANQGLKPWQFDFNYFLIITLEKLGLVSNVKRVSLQEINKNS